MSHRGKDLGTNHIEGWFGSYPLLGMVVVDEEGHSALLRVGAEVEEHITDVVKEPRRAVIQNGPRRVAGLIDNHPAVGADASSIADRWGLRFTSGPFPTRGEPWGNDQEPRGQQCLEKPTPGAWHSPLPHISLLYAQVGEKQRHDNPECQNTCYQEGHGPAQVFGGVDTRRSQHLKVRPQGYYCPQAKGL